MDRERQKKMVVQYLTTHYGITARQAIDELGIMSLSSRISELKKDGLPIKSEFIEVPTRFGDKARVKLYWMTGHPKEAFKRWNEMSGKHSARS